jgi:nicotinamide phosphoribosyltransferase
MTNINMKDFWMFQNTDTPKWSIVTDTDSYKVSMWKQYPKGTEYVSSYIESRGGRFPNTVFIGLQAFLKKLERPITREEVEFGRMFWAAHGEPFNYDGWMYIVDELDGKLPISIEAVEEGKVVPIQNALVQIVNTDPNCFWLTTWVETALLRAIWYPTTVSTLSWSIKQIIRKYLTETSDGPIEEMLPFKLHDFGSRGVSSSESAMLGGMAHLVNFMGTDTAVGMLGAMFYYGAPMDPDAGVSPAYSIPAMEHSTVTSWGRECEIDSYSNMIDQYAGEGKLYSIVSDSYDIYHTASEIWGEQLRKKVQDMGGTLVVRPDSGDPTIVPIEIIEILGDKFGYTVNSKGFKVLPDCVRVIQGDGINLDSLIKILEGLVAKGWSIDNIAFGMGGGLLQSVNRDTMAWAMKASAIKLEGETDWREVFKDPVTDKGKRSKKGRQGLFTMSGGFGAPSYETRCIDGIAGYQFSNHLHPVFENGVILKTTTFDEIRERSEDHFMITEFMPKAA